MWEGRPPLGPVATSAGPVSRQDTPGFGVRPAEGEVPGGAEWCFRSAAASLERAEVSQIGTQPESSFLRGGIQGRAALACAWLGVTPAFLGSPARRPEVRVERRAGCGPAPTPARPCSDLQRLFFLKTPHHPERHSLPGTPEGVLWSQQLRSLLPAACSQQLNAI